MGSTPKNTTTTQKVEVPEFQKPFLQDILTEAQKLYQSDTPGYFPGSTVVDQSPETLEGLNSQAQFARSNPLVNQASGVLSNTLQGNNLMPNPHTQAAYDAAAQAVTRNYSQAIRPGIDSAFSKAGRLGSNAFNNQVDTGRQQLGNTLNNLASGFFFDQFNRERQNQLNAVNQVPGLQGAAANQFGLLRDVGAAREGHNQSLLQDEINRFNFGQNLPAAKLQQYAGLVGGTDLGKAISTSQPVYSNKLAQGLGGLLSLGGLWGGNSFFNKGLRGILR